MSSPTIENYHAHVYYPDADARKQAEALREEVAALNRELAEVKEQLLDVEQMRSRLSELSRQLGV